MLTLARRLLLCLTLLMFTGMTNEAFAIRFGLNTGFYNEQLATQCFRSREFGLRLGFYADRTLNDLIYASAVRGINICGPGTPCGAPVAAPVGCSSAVPVAAPAPCGCSGPTQIVNLPAPVGCGGAPVQYSAAPAPMYAPAPAYASAPAPAKTEIYLLVLPDNGRGGNGGGNQQQQMVVLPDDGYSSSNGRQPNQQVVYYPSRPDYNQAAPQGYYREPAVAQPVRGMW